MRGRKASSARTTESSELPVTSRRMQPELAVYSRDLQTGSDTDVPPCRGPHSAAAAPALPEVTVGQTSDEMQQAQFPINSAP